MGGRQSDSPDQSKSLPDATNTNPLQKETYLSQTGEGMTVTNNRERLARLPRASRHAVVFWMQRMLGNRKTVQRLSNEDDVTSTDLPILRIGSSGPMVEHLQQLLNQILTGNLPLTIDGIFGPKTQQAVYHFQQRHQLMPDGIVGPNSWGVLKNSDVSNTVEPQPFSSDDHTGTGGSETDQPMGLIDDYESIPLGNDDEDDDQVDAGQSWVNPTAKGGILGQIYFNTDERLPTKQGYKELRSLVKAIKKSNKHKEVKLFAVGYADHRGDEQYNKKLSQDRANAVASYLLGQLYGKVNHFSISHYGVGELAKRPNDNTGDELVADRRVDIFGAPIKPKGKDNPAAGKWPGSHKFRIRLLSGSGVSYGPGGGVSVKLEVQDLDANYAQKFEYTGTAVGAGFPVSITTASEWEYFSTIDKVYLRDFEGTARLTSHQMQIGEGTSTDVMTLYGTKKLPTVKVQWLGAWGKGTGVGMSTSLGSTERIGKREPTANGAAPNYPD